MKSVRLLILLAMPAFCAAQRAFDHDILASI